MATAEESTTLDSISSERVSHVAPPDHGKGAWSFLAGCFWVEGLTWGAFFSDMRGPSLSSSLVEGYKSGLIKSL